MKQARETELDVAERTRAEPAAVAGEHPVLQLQRTAGNRAVTRLLARQPTKTFTPWNGVVSTKYSAALRSSPSKDPADPHANTIADLAPGTNVKVIGKEHGWLQVEVQVAGVTKTGYVSHELIRQVVDLGTIVVRPTTLDEAILKLKRFETKRSDNADWKPDEDEQGEIDDAIETVEKGKRYVVDRTSYRLSFAPTPGKIQIETIEDFILFVEYVERQYPSASPKEIASEIRQIWFADENWSVLLGSEGIVTDAEGAIDIETEPNPIAKSFDMKVLDPGKSGPSKRIKTRLGTVAISHVMTGIDAALSGRGKMPISTGTLKLKWETLLAADKGDPRDFATWSGDIGQAYAEYLVDRYVSDNSSATLKDHAADQASPEELLGDIHGYIAHEVWRQVPASDDPAGRTKRVSAILRTLYLVDKAGGAAGSYESYFEKVSGKSGTDLRDFVYNRSLAFARVWYAPKMRAARTLVAGRYGFSEKEILKEAMEEFDDKHSENQSSAKPQDRLDWLVDSFMALLKAPVK